MSKGRQLVDFLHASRSAATCPKGARTYVAALVEHPDHRFPTDDGNERFDDGVVDVTPERFESHVACLKKHFNPVGIDELCAFARGGKLPPNPVAITSDDGYLSADEHALPILQRVGKTTPKPCERFSASRM